MADSREPKLARYTASNSSPLDLTLGTLDGAHSYRLGANGPVPLLQSLHRETSGAKHPAHVAAVVRAPVPDGRYGFVQVDAGAADLAVGDAAGGDEAPDKLVHRSRRDPVHIGQHGHGVGGLAMRLLSSNTAGTTLPRRGLWMPSSMSPASANSAFGRYPVRSVLVSALS